MSDLQIGLLILGLVVIGGVVAFNWLQEKKFRQRAEQNFNRPDADVLLGSAQTQQQVRSGSVNIEERIDPQLEPVAETAAVEETGAVQEEEAPVVVTTARTDMLPDAAINYVAEIRCKDLLPAQTIVSLDATLKQTGRKSALFVYDEPSGSWQLPPEDTDRRFSALKLYVQLVDRGGAATEDQLESVATEVARQAEEISASFDATDIREALSRAIALDDFCVEVDVIVGLSVAARPGQVLHGTQLRALAEANGLQLRPDGVFIMPDGMGGALFSLDNQETNPFRTEDLKNLTTRAVTFLLDVPRTGDGIKVLNKMIAVSKKFADSLDAVLCDDNRAVLNDSVLEKIRNQLRTIYEAMDRRGIPAGGATARQLFS